MIVFKTAGSLSTKSINFDENLTTSINYSTVGKQQKFADTPRQLTLFVKHASNSNSNE